ncbi:hypothetical protein SAMN05421749_101199 [Acinetobacter marinus]|uniref:DAPG hydrolase PhiG domain-containing protein n=1 Tax=Acinetobacter marinus TaxID=281375 RepID=A0A1G6GQK1_9GAMM|nr:hypothetical protein [Acinetobacter marinus]SDB83476.1 hypothetical protein SAMN05421749_101199 [Acinetobacter marinus]
MSKPEFEKKVPVTTVVNHPKHGANTPYKQLDTANAHYVLHDNATSEAYIEHANMRGVTPEMMLWFFKHLDCYTTYNPATGDFDGPEIAVYRLWHCRDHIAIKLLKPGKYIEDADCAVSYDSTFSINEIILQKYPIESCSLVYDLYYDDEHGKRIGDGTQVNGSDGKTKNIGNFGFWLLGPLGMRCGYINHFFSVVDAEQQILSFHTQFILGSPSIKILHSLLPKILPNGATPERFLKDWILHNVEESGESEKIVPILFANQDKVFRRSELLNRTVL